MLANRIRSFLPVEGGILTLWSAGTVIGLFFLIRSNLFVGTLQYLIGSLFFLASVQAVKEFITYWTRRKEIHRLLTVPLLLGILTWTLGPSNMTSVTSGVEEKRKKLGNKSHFRRSRVNDVVSGNVQIGDSISDSRDCLCLYHTLHFLFISRVVCTSYCRNS